MSDEHSHPNPDVERVRHAAADVIAARTALQAAAERRAAASQVARNLMETAVATERAEVDAARDVIAAAVRRSGAAHLPAATIVDMCQLPSHQVEDYLAASGGTGDGRPEAASRHGYCPTGSPRPGGAG